MQEGEGKQPQAPDRPGEGSCGEAGWSRRAGGERGDCGWWERGLRADGDTWWVS